MAYIYEIAYLTSKRVFKSNLSACYAAIKLESNGSAIFHGTTNQDQYRLKPVNNYGGLRTACIRDAWYKVPFFFHEDGAKRAFVIFRHVLSK
jgi:hypothetical protein